MKVGIVFNPQAGAGRLRARWPRIAAELRENFPAAELCESRSVGDACVIARRFAGTGFDLVVAAGGDGTVSEVADGLLQMRTEDGVGPALGILPCGTGADFARGLGLPCGDIGAAIRRIAAGKERVLDAGRVCFLADGGRLAARHFVNIASLGLSGNTDRAVNADRRRGRLAAKPLYLWHVVSEFARFRFQRVRIVIDDGMPIERRVALVAVASGRFFGGGMMVAPDAEPDDGFFDVVILSAAGKLGLIRDIRLLYRGRHRSHPAVTILRGRKITVEPLGESAADAALIDIDGESPGRIPATFEMLPRALKVRV